MLKIILSALFLTGVLACVKYHEKADEEYQAALKDGQQPLRFISKSDLESPQHVEITCLGSTGLKFMLLHNQNTEDVKFYSNTSKKPFILRWFAFNNDQLYLFFSSERPLGKRIHVSSKVFTMPTTDENELLEDAQRRAVHIQLMTEEDKINLSNQTGSKRDAKLNIAWIKNFFAMLDKTQPLSPHFWKNNKQSSGAGVFIGPPITMDADALRNLAQLSKEMQT